MQLMHDFAVMGADDSRVDQSESRPCHLCQLPAF